MCRRFLFIGDDISIWRAKRGEIAGDDNNIDSLVIWFNKLSFYYVIFYIISFNCYNVTDNK